MKSDERHRLDSPAFIYIAAGCKTAESAHNHSGRVQDRYIAVVGIQCVRQSQQRFAIVARHMLCMNRPHQRRDTAKVRGRPRSRFPRPPDEQRSGTQRHHDHKGHDHDHNPAQPTRSH